MATVTDRSAHVVRTAVNRLVATTKRQPTEYQIGVFAWLLTGVGHAFVEAVAGSGKTATLVWAAQILNQSKILMLAFNKSIATELTARIPANCVAKTLHSLGMGACRSAIGNFTVDDTKTEKIAKGISNYDMMSKSRSIEFDKAMPALCRIVGLFKNFAYDTIVHAAPTKEDINELSNKHNIDLPEDMPFDDFCQLCLDTFDASNANTRIIDFDDMIYLPVKLRAPLPTYYDFIFIDESQDLNPAQIEMVKMMCKSKSRAVFVGDRFQSIYGFRGADPEAIDKVIADFNATTLPLSICWRCPRNVIDSAQKIVPAIQPAPDATDGIVGTIDEDKFFEIVGGNADNGEVRPDMVLCRVMAPLVDMCYRLIREGIKATVKGRDIGVGLCNLIDKIAKARVSANSEDIYDKIIAYQDKQYEKLNKKGKESALMNMMDRLDTIKVLSEGCPDFACIKAKVREIFSDEKGSGVQFSTVHRAKGLEAERVFIIDPTLMPHPLAKQPWMIQQEINLKYVAITRATSELYWVTVEKSGTTKKGKRTTEELLTSR